MSASTDVGKVLAVLSRTLLWCFVLGILLLLIWFGCFMAGGDFAYRFHATMFDLSKHEFDVMNYYGMAFTKLCTLLFFLVPYLAIRLVQKGIEE